MRKLKRRLKVIYTIVGTADDSYRLKTKRGTDWDYRNPLPAMSFPSYKEVAAYLMENAPFGKHEIRWDGLSNLEQIAVQTLEFKLNNRLINRHSINGGNGSHSLNGSPLNRTLYEVHKG